MNYKNLAHPFNKKKNLVNQILLSSKQTKNQPNKLQIWSKILTTNKKKIKQLKSLKNLPFFLVSALCLSLSLILSDSFSLPCSHLLNSLSKAASFLRLDRLSHSFSESVSPPPASLILSQFL